MRELEKLRAELAVTRELLDRHMRRSLIGGKERLWWVRFEPNWLISEETLSWQLRPRLGFRKRRLSTAHS